MRLLLALCVLAVSACASGVVMTDEEVIACRDQGCVPMTRAELIEFRKNAYDAGYQQGWRDSNVQAGRDL